MYTERGYQLTKPHSGRKHVVARKGEERQRDSVHVNVGIRRMTQGWYATTVPPCCPSCHHMIRPSLIRDHRNSGTTGSLPYKQRGIYRHSYATHKLSHEHAKHLPYQMFKHACLVRRSRSLARRSSRLRRLSRNLRQSRNGF